MGNSDKPLEREEAQMQNKETVVVNNEMDIKSDKELKEQERLVESMKVNEFEY
ncbi:hypothetical protein [Paenibacillus caui]|uniref:hypothetical protein n=1 Tax=Paenibacillus caui TaxID=2873927 RepID=UPI001CA82415|nr:hypothetical protein [Paenibacillus caui]